MGIDGLLGLLRPLATKMHISQFKGKTLGVDILPWLYKGCYSSVMQMGEQLISDQSANYTCSEFLLLMLNMLDEYGVKMIAVYDGRILPMKEATVKKRQSVRQTAAAKSASFLQKNNTTEARKHRARSIRVSQATIIQSMRILHTKNVPFIVSPYQSDCQLAKLKQLSIVDAVVSEDSDLLVYGCNVIYKLDEEGMCQYIDIDAKLNIEASLGQQQVQENYYVKKFKEMGKQERISVCVLAGCDYLSSVKGIGIKKAIKMVDNEPDISELLRKLAGDKVFGQRVPQQYSTLFLKCITIFNHALTYNPITRTIQPLTPNTTDCPLSVPQFLQTIGPVYPEYLTEQVYNGITNARTLQTRRIEKIELKQIEQDCVQAIGLAELTHKISAEMSQFQLDSNTLSDSEMHNIIEQIFLLPSPNNNVTLS